VQADLQSVRPNAPESAPVRPHRKGVRRARPAQQERQTAVAWTRTRPGPRKHFTGWHKFARLF
jgi:hypothetical protein